jgi:Tol biopolymer transport system component
VSAPALLERQITANPPEDYIRTAALSPDGQYVAYHDLTGLYLRSVESGETRSISLPAGFGGAIAGLEWFPDGGKLLAVVNSPEPYALWVITILGEAQPRLLYQHGIEPAISPDGQSVAFMQCCMGKNLQDILVGGMKGEKPRVLVAVPDMQSDAAQLKEQTVLYPAWSPDGRWIAYLRRWKTAQGSQTSAIEARSASGGAAQVVLRQASLPTGTSLCAPLAQDSCMVWSPDGRLIFSAVQPAESPSAETKYSLWQIRVRIRTAKAAGRPGPLTPWSDINQQHLSITRDGRRLSVLKERAWDDVYLAELAPDGVSMTQPRRFTLDNRGILTLDSWTSDRQALLFSSSRNGNAEIFKKGLNENIAEVLVRGPDGYCCARLTTDGVWMIYTEWSPMVLGAAAPRERIMRRSTAGGPLQMLHQEPGGNIEGSYVWDYKCPLKLGSPCVIGEKSGNDLIFYSLDPVQGKV